MTFIGKLRNMLWPIYGIEHKKFLPMTLMISLILFDYTILRNIKDTLVISATGSSEIITFLKVWVVLPLAFLFFLIFTKLTNIYSKQTVFYITISFFLLFLITFAYIIYPNLIIFTPTHSAEWLESLLPSSMKNFVNLYRFWSLSLFYCMAELWGSVAGSLLFWQFANNIVQVSEAKRFYAHFYLLANIATAMSGLVTKYVNSLGRHLPAGIERYSLTLSYLVLICVIFGMIVMLLYYYMDKNVVNDPKLVSIDKNISAKNKSKKPKLSMSESIRFIMVNPYLGLIAALVISYGISINLVEVNWKHQVHLAFPTPNDFNAYMGMVSFYSGITTFFVILLGAYLVRLLGWRAGALATPIIIGITGALFFYLMIFNDQLETLAAMWGTTAIMLPAIVGTIQNILSKSTKYALFDPTKEMSYIPLDEESKAKGKAAVDVVGGRFGKAGGALIQQIMFMFIGPIALIAPYSASIMLGIVFFWCFAVIALHKRFKALGGE